MGEIALNIIEFVGIVVLCVTAIAAAYYEIVEVFYNKNIPLPKFIEKQLYLRKTKEILSVLSELGLKNQSNFYNQANKIYSITEKRPYSDYREELHKILADCFSKGQYNIGMTYTYRFQYFIDLMGASINYQVAERCACIMSNFIRDELKKNIMSDGEPISFDKLVVPKLGSPTIGFLLSNIQNIPCVFFRSDNNPKFRNAKDPLSYFDGDISSGEKIILVDDSTTGGRMFSQAILRVRAAGGIVQHAFVLFEPLGKGAREKLNGYGVELHSIIQLTDEEIKHLEKLA